MTNRRADERYLAKQEADRRSTLRFLTHHHLDDLFDVVITRDDVRRLKPHPEPIFKAAETLGLSSEQCVMVGDTLADIRSARAATARASAVIRCAKDRDCPAPGSAASSASSSSTEQRAGAESAGAGGKSAAGRGARDSAV
jgi:beta-phosphoglucomutase-like phosphatase (HAD superfamily)